MNQQFTSHFVEQQSWKADLEFLLCSTVFYESFHDILRSTHVLSQQIFVHVHSAETYKNIFENASEQYQRSMVLKIFDKLDKER